MVSLGKTELVIIADDIVGESLHTLIINKIRGTFTALGIKAPGFGLRKRDYLEDIATLVGATLITSDLGMKLENVKIEHLGSADRIISNKEKTTIVGGKGNKEAVIQRVESIKKEIEKTESRHDVLKLEERIAKLQGTVAVIKIGGSTEVETKYLKLKLEDAVSAVKAALSEGIVPGGGIALIKSRQSIIKPEDMTFDEELGFNIVCKAVEVPLQQIAINSGGGDGSGVVDRVISMKNTPNGGYDALKGVYSDDLIKD